MFHIDIRHRAPVRNAFFALILLAALVPTGLVRAATAPADDPGRPEYLEKQKALDAERTATAIALEVATKEFRKRLEKPGLEQARKELWQAAAKCDELGVIHIGTLTPQQKAASAALDKAAARVRELAGTDEGRYQAMAKDAEFQAIRDAREKAFVKAEKHDWLRGARFMTPVTVRELDEGKDKWVGKAVMLLNCRLESVDANPSFELGTPTFSVDLRYEVDNEFRDQYTSFSFKDPAGAACRAGLTSSQASDLRQCARGALIDMRGMVVRLDGATPGYGIACVQIILHRSAEGGRAKAEPIGTGELIRPVRGPGVKAQ